MQYIVTAYDGTDEKALERRMVAREEHVRTIEREFKSGAHKYGAAILDESGKTIGSLLVVDYPSRDELDNWLKFEPHVVGNVWQRIEIQPCKVSSIFLVDS